MIRSINISIEKRIWRQVKLLQGKRMLECASFNMLLIDYLSGRDGFCAAVITTVSAFDYEKMLADCIPLGYMYPIYLVEDRD